MPASRIAAPRPTFDMEAASEGPVAGFDEAGRGPLAGPVVAACVSLQGDEVFLGHVHDSKKLGMAAREQLFAAITSTCAFGIGVADAGEIDRLNILQATFLAMARAEQALHMGFGIRPATALIDGNQRPRGLVAPIIRTVVKGDSLSLSIASASILAKVTRDRLMAELHAQYPHYAWARNAGYPTPDHLAALRTHGPCPLHRASYAPVRQAIEMTRKTA